MTNIGFPSTLSRFELESGILIWRKDFYDTNPSQLVFFNNFVQLITWKPGLNLWVLDIDGNVITHIKNTDAFLTTPEVTFYSVTGIRAVRTGTDEVLWEYSDPAFQFMPVITQDKFFCRNESYSGTAYALDRNTGKLLWQVHDIVPSSTLAYSQRKQLVYALRKNGDLLAIDENSGEVSIATKFSSTPFLLDIAETAQTYILVYDQEQHILLVSLGDSHQLFAFREE